MTAVTARTAQLDLDAVLRDGLRAEMLRHLKLAEKAEQAWLKRDAANLDRYRRTARSEDEARVNAATFQPVDPLLQRHGWLLNHHRAWAGTYAAVLQAEAAYTALSSGPRPRRAQSAPNGNDVRSGAGS